MTHGVGTIPAGTKNHTASWWDCFFSCCFIAQERSSRDISCWNLHHWHAGLFLSPEGSVGCVLCYSSVRRSLCWKLTFISSGTPTDKGLVSFIFLSSCNTDHGHKPPSFISLSFVRGHYAWLPVSPLSLQTRSRLTPDTTGLCLSLDSCWPSVFSLPWPERAPTCLHLAVCCVCCLPFNCELSAAKPCGYKLVIPRTGCKEDKKKRSTTSWSS